MKELDFLLLRYLGLRLAASDERAAFAEFLELPDPDIARYLLAGDVPPDPRHAAPVPRLLNRIDLMPSRFAAAALVRMARRWSCAVILFAVALPWPARIALCLASRYCGVRCIRSFVLLAGPRAVRAIEWSEAGEFGVCLGPQLHAASGHCWPGSFRLGVRIWVLRFMTPAGLCPVLIAGGVQDAESVPAPFPVSYEGLRRASGRADRPRCYHPAQGLKCVTRH